METDPRKKLSNAFQSIANWTEANLGDAPLKPREQAFLRSLRKYAIESLRLVPAARSPRDIARLERRAKKATDAAISYVQKSLKNPRMGE